MFQGWVHSSPQNLLHASLMPETENCPCDESVLQLAEKGWKGKVCPGLKEVASLASQVSKYCLQSSKISCTLSTLLLRTTVVGSVVMKIRSAPYRGTRASPFYKLPSAASVLGMPAAHRAGSLREEAPLPSTGAPSLRTGEEPLLQRHEEAEHAAHLQSRCWK